MHQNSQDFVDIQDHGFRVKPRTPDQYMLGASKFADRPVILPTRDWGPYKPKAEVQSRNGFESFNCSNYGTHNAYESLAKLLGFTDFPSDCSERYSGVGTGTTKDGNDPHGVAEKMRTEIGFIAEEQLPFGPDIETWEQYYFPNPMRPEYLALGRKILQKFEFGHDWVFFLSGTPEQKAVKLREALGKGPVAVSVLAWKRRGGLYWKDVGEQDTHWCQLLRENPDGTWRVFDSYDKFEKDLEKGYDFGFAKVYYMRRYAPGEVQQKKSQLMKVVETLIELLTRLLAALAGALAGIFQKR